MHLFSFEKLDVWKEAMELTKFIYSVTGKFPETEKFGLVTQLRRASVSVSSNLAEGSSRMTQKDKAYFTTMAYSSTMEVLNQMVLSERLGMITNEELLGVRERIYKISNMLNALRKSQLKT
jgi:four helix bundle protein